MSTSLTEDTRVDQIPGLSHAEAMRLGESQIAVLLRELEALDPEDWGKPTDCERWSVRDIVAHLLGWATTLTSPKEAVRMMKQTRAVRKEFGPKLDAQNEALVIARRGIPPDQLIRQLEETSPRFLKVRRRLGLVGKPIPIYIGSVGWMTLQFLMGQIFTRDYFMHRIDIARATDGDLEIGKSESRIIADIVRHWARNSKADTRLILTGRGGGTFVMGVPDGSSITGDAIEFCRVLSGRGDPALFQVEGDPGAASRWLATTVPF
jgi:uncharacterized protein (TIGR03083 family)